MVPFSFADEDWQLVGGAALYRPASQALLVADLHLEKASFFARRGQMLPPYDSRETLARIADAICKTGARRVFCLGDSYHDNDGEARLDPHAAGMLEALTRAVDWLWITGNHDEAVSARHGGTVVDELVDGGIILRHEARRGEQKPEISGHFHPKLRLVQRGRSISRPCLVASESRMILPAFGAFTGGLDARDPAILSALQPARSIAAHVPSAARLLRFPLWNAA